MSDNIDIFKKEEYPVDKNIKLWGMPGCGKTTQAIERLKKYMEKENLESKDITLCTYRKSLSFELLEKLKNDGLIDKNKKYSDTYIGTIHGICRRIIQDSELDYNINNFIDESNKKEFCNMYNKEYYNNSPEKSEGEVLFDIFSYFKNTKNKTGDIPYDKEKEFEKMWGYYDIKEIIEDWKKYKNKNNLYSFDDLLYIVKEEELIPPNEFIFIDELHDAYPLLYDVIKMWIEKTKEEDGVIIVAGDPLQVINSYQGATPKYFKNIDIPRIVLDKSYRCPEEIWKKGLEVLSYEFKNNEIPDIKTHKNNGNVIERERTIFSKDINNNWSVVDQELSPNRLSKKHKNIMFLVRARYQIKPIVKNLKNKGIIYSTKHDSSWDSDKNDKLCIYNTLQKISKMKIKNEDYNRDEKHLKYKIKNNTYLKPEEFDCLKKYLPKNKYFYTKKYKTDNHLINLEKLHQVIKKQLLNTSTQEIINDLKLEIENKQTIQKAYNNYNKTFNKYNLPVEIRTIHEAKGLEKETVVLYDSITENINKNILNNKKTKNECRVWFVAITRSSKNLYILKNSYSNKKPKTPYL